jgi:3-oxoacyl-[acyl-carrier-protein] synthase II
MTEAQGAPRRRVAVTGLGVKAPAGTDVESFWTALREGRSFAAPIRRFDGTILAEPFRFACEVADFDPERYIPRKEIRHYDRVAQLGLGAALDALEDAGELGADPARCGVVAASGVGGLMTLEEQAKVLFERGSDRVSPFLVPMMMANATAARVGIQLGWTGPNLCVATACAAGNNALGEGAMLVRYGAAEVVLAGGTEACNTPLAMSAFAKMGALSRRASDPERASRPFDPDRDGFVMGEGAGFLVLEEYDRAVARGAHIWGEILGYGRNSDAHHITAPGPGGLGAVTCMQAALADAGLEPSDIGHINAHGTSTPLNDAAEAEAITKIFGEGGVPVTSAKGSIGHLVGGAGAVEAVASLLALRDGVIPPTANHDRHDPELTIDVVAGSERPVERRPVLSNSFGFGGHNATIVLGPPPPAPPAG